MDFAAWIRHANVTSVYKAQVRWSANLQNHSSTSSGIGAPVGKENLTGILTNEVAARTVPRRQRQRPSPSKRDCRKDNWQVNMAKHANGATVDSPASEEPHKHNVHHAKAIDQSASTPHKPSKCHYAGIAARIRTKLWPTHVATRVNIDVEESVE